MHQIFTKMYLTVLIGLPYMESPMGFSPPPCPLSPYSNDISLDFTIEPLPFVTYPFFFIRTFKTISKANSQKNSENKIPPSSK